MYWQRVAARVSAETPINKHGAREISEPTLNPCVTRAGFRHLRTRHRLTTQLRAVKSHPRFPAATEIPEVRYCAQGFNVGPRYFPGVVRVQRLRQSAFVLRLGYIDPAESFAFPLPACTSPTLNRPGADLRDSSRDGHSASLPEAQPPTRHLAPSHVAHQPAHSPTRITARYLPFGGRRPGTGCEP